MKPFELINLDAYLDERPAEGVIRVDRSIFTDPAIFELEMERIFGRAWVYVGHESQVKKPGDYFATRMGRKAIVMVRDNDGAIHIVHNQCAHRGAMVVATDKGNAPEFTCCYHGWTFDIDGTILSTPAEPPTSRIRELRRMIEAFGLEVVQAYVRHVQANAEASVRRVIGVLKSGTAESRMDTGETLRVRIDIDAAKASAPALLVRCRKSSNSASLTCV